MRTRWKDFLIDIGDTIGGIILGMSLDADSKAMMIGGVLLITTSIYLEYFNKGVNESKKAK